MKMGKNVTLGSMAEARVYVAKVAFDGWMSREEAALRVSP